LDRTPPASQELEAHSYAPRHVVAGTLVGQIEAFQPDRVLNWIARGEGPLLAPLAERIIWA
jgi:hypothetical protein